ncbi:hypothetical protein ANO11243_074870 [Dothideomycetidae sp. 11243]|nr:hypothetical protein ANO11243_074870 [fungal sp. No.11243]
MIVWVATLFLAGIFAIVTLRKHLSTIRHKPEITRDSSSRREQIDKPGSTRAVQSRRDKVVPTLKMNSDDRTLNGQLHNDNDEAETTPKAQPAMKSSPDVPLFNLDEAKQDPVSPTTRIPATTSTIPRSSTGKSNASHGLMPPPRLPSKLAPLPSGQSGLRVPSTGPLPNRNPNAGLSIPANGVAPAANTAGKRNKVLLKPGHSPLDWATLTRSSANLAGVPGLQRVTPSMLKFHHGRKGRPAWASYKGKVYNITPYLPFHPGGEGELMRAAGKDGEKLFMEYHPWVNWDNMLSSCLVGIVVSESAAEEDLEDLD